MIRHLVSFFIFYLCLKESMGIVQKDAIRTMIASYVGVGLGYLNKAVLFVIILSTEQIGLVNLIVSVGTLFAQFANMGTFYTTWKFTPFFKDSAKKHHGFLPLMLLIVSIGSLLLTILSFVFRKQIEELYRERSSLFVDYYIWMIPIGLAYVFFMVFEVYLRSFFKNIISVIAYEIVLRFILTCLLGLLWFNFIGFDQFVILHSLFYFVPTIILVIYLYRLDELNLRINSIRISKRFRKIMIRFSMINYINTLGYVLITSLDILMVAQMIGLKATGVYSTMVFFAGAIQVPYKSMHRASVPLVAEHWKHREMNKMEILYKKFSSVSLVIGFGFFLVVWLNRVPLFAFLPSDFKDGIWIFFFLMMGKLVDMYCGLNGSILVTSKKYSYDVYFTLFLIGAVFVLNICLIPEYGAIGAAISTLIAMLIYNVGRIIFVAYHFGLYPFQRQQLYVILLGLLTMIIGYFTVDFSNNIWLQLMIQTAVTVLFFFTPIYAFSLEPESVVYIKGLLKSVKNKFGI
jgi:O-antigen/teichoic acid export membrane protein